MRDVKDDLRDLIEILSSLMVSSHAGVNGRV